MDSQSPLVYVVDDDEPSRDALCLLLSSVGIDNYPCTSAAHFLSVFDPARPGCLLADIRMPGMTGLGLQAELEKRDVRIPIIFVTAYADVPMAVQAMKSGALDFLQKPYREQDLLDRVNDALRADAEYRRNNRDSLAVRERLDSLTSREHEILDRVTHGHSNKAIAADLGVSQRTVEIHRARVMQKMGAGSLAELIKLVDKLI